MSALQQQEAEAFLRTREKGELFIAKAGAITFAVHPVKRSPRLRAFCSSPVFQDLCHDLIGPGWLRACTGAGRSSTG